MKTPKNKPPLAKTSVTIGTKEDVERWRKKSGNNLSGLLQKLLFAWETGGRSL